MSVVRVLHNKDNPYFIANKKIIEIPTLSWEAKGLWSYLISRPDNWHISAEHLSKNFPSGRDKVLKLLKELNEYGLCERKDHRVNGKSAGTEYIVYEEQLTLDKFPQKPLKSKSEPFPEKPLTEMPLTETPLTVEPTLLNTDNILNTERTNTLLPTDKSVANSEVFSINPINSETSLSLSKALYDGIVSWKGNIKYNLSKSASDIDKMLCLDDRTPQQIENVIDWLSHSEDQDAIFWKSNILSGSKLRSKFDTIEARMKTSQKQCLPKTKRFVSANEKESRSEYINYKPMVFS